MILSVSNLVFKDFWLKLFSFALAVLMWFTISSAIEQEGSSKHLFGAGSEERTFNAVPVIVLSSARQVLSCRIHPETVTVVVRGDPALIRGLGDNAIEVSVDLTDIAAARTFTKRVKVSAPAGVEHTVQPDEVVITFPDRN
jgi:YbbR domain-containing protein